MIDSSSLRKLRRTLEIIIIAFLSLYNPISSSSQYHSYIFSNHIVESFGSLDLLRQNVPLRQLEKRWNNRVDAIYYFVESSGFIIPSECGTKRLIYLGKKLSISTRTLPLNIVNTKLHYIGWGSGRTTEERNEDWIKEISSLISKSKSKLHIVEKSAFTNTEPQSYQVSFKVKWETFPDKETLSRYRYLLFLVADAIHGEDFFPCIGNRIFENVAYDFIPLEGDDPKKFDGSGLLLESSNRKISPADPVMELKTATFKLPEIKRDTGWSLHLILEDPENLGKTIFSYKIRLLNR